MKEDSLRRSEQRRLLEEFWPLQWQQNGMLQLPRNLVQAAYVCKRDSDFIGADDVSSNLYLPSQFRKKSCQYEMVEPQHEAPADAL